MTISTIVSLVAVCSLTSYFFGWITGDVRGYKRVGNARHVHMQDLNNVNTLVCRGDVVAASNYAIKALASVETNPIVLQKVPEDVP